MIFAAVSGSVTGDRSVVGNQFPRRRGPAGRSSWHMAEGTVRTAVEHWSFCYWSLTWEESVRLVALPARSRPSDSIGATVTRMLSLASWPAGMRVVIRAERPHPGAQLRFTDSGGNRLTAFVTNTP